MKTFKILFLLLTALIISSLTGCYTQVATTDPEPYSTTTIYKQSTESDNYYSEDGELLDSSYYSEIDPEYEESVTIINQYYSDYPSGYYDYFPYLSIGIGFSWYWGWGSYYSYWPYYSGIGAVIIPLIAIIHPIIITILTIVTEVTIPITVMIMVMDTDIIQEMIM